MNKIEIADFCTKHNITLKQFFGFDELDKSLDLRTSWYLGKGGVKEDSFIPEGFYPKLNKFNNVIYIKNCEVKFIKHSDNPSEFTYSKERVISPRLGNIFISAFLEETGTGFGVYKTEIRRNVIKITTGEIMSWSKYNIKEYDFFSVFIDMFHKEKYVNVGHNITDFNLYNYINYVKN